jgi:hypothetical protein
MMRSRRLAVCLLLPAITLLASTSSIVSAKTPKSKAAKKKQTSASPAKPAAGAAVKLTIASNGYLKRDIVISAPAGTTAKKIVDSVSTLVTFSDGSQMTAFPDAAFLLDYQKSLPTTGDGKVTFVVTAADHFTFVDPLYSRIPNGISFYAKRDLATIVENKALATGLVCTNHGTEDTKQTSNEATISVMIATCLSAMPA